MTGDQLIAGRYRLAEPIGEGGMGVVWRARDEFLARDVAVKEIIFPVRIPEDERRLACARSVREARAAARLSHSGVITVHDVVEHDGRPWIVMELFRGGSLADLITEGGPLEPQRVAEIGLRVLEALCAAHAAGIVHRDVKPANVLVNGHRVVLTDFGAASIQNDPTLTRSGTFIGTPAYLAPERAQGMRAVPESDLWSLGATLYAAVEGRPPYVDPDSLAVLSALLTSDPPQPRRAGPLAPILTGLMRRDMAQRMSAGQARDLLATVAAPKQAAQAPARTPTEIVGGSSHPSTYAPGGPPTITSRSRMPAASSPESQRNIPSQPQSAAWPPIRAPRPAPQPPGMSRPPASTPVLRGPLSPKVKASSRPQNSSARAPGRGTVRNVALAGSLSIIGILLIAAISIWGFEAANAPPRIYGLSTPVSAQQTRSLMYIHGVKIYRSAFNLVCDPSINSGDNQGCSSSVHQLHHGLNGSVYLGFGGISWEGLNRLCHLGYHSWLSDNQSGKPHVEDEFQLPGPNSPAKYKGTLPGDYYSPPPLGARVPGSSGDVCYDITQSGSPDYVGFNVNETFVAVGPWRVTWRLYDPSGKVVLTTIYRATVIP